MNDIDYPYSPATLQWPRSQKPILIVIHTMEAPEIDSTAEACAKFFQKPNAQGSAHLCIDNDSIRQCVPYSRMAAGARGGPYNGKSVNTWSIHLEHAGYAKQTLAEWSDPYSQKERFWSSIACAKICVQFGIHSNLPTIEELRAGKGGITTHWMVSQAFKVGSGHWDPGPNFPLQAYRDAVANWIPHVKV